LRAENATDGNTLDKIGGGHEAVPQSTVPSNWKEQVWNLEKSGLEKKGSREASSLNPQKKSIPSTATQWLKTLRKKPGYCKT